MGSLKKPTGKKEPGKPLPQAVRRRPMPIPPDPATEQPDTSTPKDFVEIGSSPVPGLTLRHVLRGHKDAINRIAWSPDGKYLASPSEDKTIHIWDVSTGECVRVLEGHTDTVFSVAWSPDGQILISGGSDGTIQIWNTKEWHLLTEPLNQSTLIRSVSWNPHSNQLASSDDSGAVTLWNTINWKKDLELDLKGSAFSIAWSPTENIIATGMENGEILIIDANFGRISQRLKVSKEEITSLAWSPLDSHLIAAATESNTIEICDTREGRTLVSLEGHDDWVTSVSFSKDGRLLASKSRLQNGTVRLWFADTWLNGAEIKSTAANWWSGGIAFHPISPILATLGEGDTIIRIWELDETVLLGQAKENVNYTTAKLVLVGDSGVGKTGLGWRLAHGEFKEHASTHGQQFWSIPQLNLKRKDGTDCEAVLWDLAGQHVYRQVHSIFLENVAAALVLFDPTNRQEPLKGAQFWLEQLKGKGQLPPTVLVGARVDRGAPALSHDELNQFCQRYGIKGRYISTSALKGDGLDELLDLLKALIPWDDMTATVTTVTFKRIKDYVLSLKEKTDRKGVLVSPSELRALLEQTSEVSKTSEVSEPWNFTDAEMMTAVGHLETHGYVSILHNSAGEQYILLTPDLLVNLAASIMLLADKNARELGAVSETELLQGKYPFDELKGLEPHEAQTLLDAAILRFLEHNICFRDTFGNDTLLIFPSLIKQKRPLQDDAPATDDISYVVRGRVENLYASLVVLLGYTPSFSRINQWQNQAQYEMEAGQVCGFRSIEEREGELELVLYYGEHMPQNGRDKFQELFEQFLYQREVEVTRYPPVICKNGHQQKRSTVIERVRDKKPFMFCDECGDKVLLPDFDQPQTIGIGASPWLQREEAMARLRSAYEKHLTNIKSYRRGWATPRAYLSYLPEQKEWAKKLVHDLQDAGVYIVEKPEDLKADDYAILLDTPAYRKAFQSASSALAADAKVIHARMQAGNKKILSLGCEGELAEHKFAACVPGNFCDETHYSVSLFNLVMELYAIPLNHKGFEPLRSSLHEQWENTLAGKKGDATTTPLKVFISYSHKDEEFKDELVTMLEGLRRQGIIDPWQDRRIEEGDEWYQEIQDAMNECDLAILLVSQNFIASRFIQDEELPRLLQRRREAGMRVVPIIVRPCKWQSEPALSKLQALPKDGKAVITFSKDNGDRDQAWTDIATAIEKRAKAKSSP
jgi:small GTP-binding protein